MLAKPINTWEKITEQLKTTLNVEGMFELEAGSYYEDLVTLQIVRGEKGAFT